MHTKFEQDLLKRPQNKGMDITQRMTHSILRRRETNRRLEKNRCCTHQRLPTATDETARSSAVTGGADGGVAALGHGGHHRRSHGGGIDAVFSLPPPTPPAEAVTTAAGEGGQQGLTETRVHEAVNDGVDAGGGVRQQVDEGNGSS